MNDDESWKLILQVWLQWLFFSSAIDVVKS